MTGQDPQRPESNAVGSAADLIAGIAQCGQRLGDLQDVGNVEDGKAEFPPVAAGFVAVASRIGGRGRVDAQQELDALLDGRLDQRRAALGRPQAEGKHHLGRAPGARQSAGQSSRSRSAR